MPIGEKSRSGGKRKSIVCGRGRAAFSEVRVFFFRNDDNETIVGPANSPTIGTSLMIN